MPVSIMSRILITGANGWIGQALGSALAAQGDTVWGLTRRRGTVPEGVAEWLHAAPDFAGLAQSWPAEREFDVVLHLAARVHSQTRDEGDLDASYMATNATATLRLAELARERGVGRFVFLSSIKALGEKDSGHPWREEERARPEDAYGRSKRRAEEDLANLSGIETVVLRPPLVYGPGVKANFARLLGALQRGWPLPLGRVKAVRSLIYIDNLVDALCTCAKDARAAGRLFHVADADPLPVVDLLQRLGILLERPARLLPVPVGLLRAAGSLLGRGAEVARLTDTLRLDTGLVERTLGWRPPLSTDEGLARTVSWYRTTC
jgi:UDP-glucose 4-epimerase